MDPIEEIKARLDIVEVIKGYTPLVLAGANYKARCPFHQEKTGSFMVSPSKQIWHCFGCGAGGDLFGFIMKQEGLEFGEALRLLADRAGVTLSDRQSSSVARGEKSRLVDMLELAAKWYHQALLRSAAAERAREYIRTRGLDQGLIDEFTIGFALPERESLSQFLLSRKFTAGEIINGGLAIKKEFGYGIFDRFRNRLMIPIRNAHGSVVGFSGRIIDANDESAKYINSPQSILYDKGKILFGLDMAKQEIRHKGFAILVEGPMDFFAVWSGGMKNVVASSGTALTVEQIGLLKRFAHSLYLCFDNDTAGNQAALRGIELALREGLDVKIIRLPSDERGTALYKDPDECIKKDPAAWQQSVEHAVSFVEFYCDVVAPFAAHADPFKKKTAARRVLGVIQLIPDNLERDIWVKFVAARFGFSERILWDELRALDGAALRDRAGSQVSKSAEESESKRHSPSRDEIVLALILSAPERRSFAADLEPAAFAREDHRAIFVAVREGSGIPSDLAAEAARLELLASHAYPNAESAELDAIARECVILMKREYHKQRLSELQRLVRHAEESGDAAAVASYLKEFAELQKAEPGN